MEIRASNREAVRRSESVWFGQADGEAQLTSHPDACGAKPTRCRSTIADYHKDLRTLTAQSHAPSEADDRSRLLHVIGWVAGQNGAWAPATIRKYRASLRSAIEEWTLSGVDIERAHVSQLHRALDDAAPAPRDNSAAPRTSAAKRRSFSLEERDKLILHLVADSDEAGQAFQ